MILEASPIPNKMIIRGMSAIGGSARKKLMAGSISIRTTRNHPIRNPQTIAITMPSENPQSTRRKLAYMWY